MEKKEIKITRKGVEVFSADSLFQHAKTKNFVEKDCIEVIIKKGKEIKLTEEQAKQTEKRNLTNSVDEKGKFNLIRLSKSPSLIFK